MKFRDILNELGKQIPQHSEPTTDMELLRQAIILEMDTINSYEFMARKAQSGDVKKVLLEVSKEEKHHIYEFELLLEKIDKELKHQKHEAEEELEDMGIK